MRTGTTAALVASLVILLAGPADGQRARDPSVITPEELDQLPPNTSVHDAINVLRPSWLRPRGPQSIPTQRPGAPPNAIIQDPDEIVVYWENARYGAEGTLRNFYLDQIDWIEYYDPVRANRRWGSGHVRGAIVLHPKGIN